jgi:putative PIN family toxin of toxin-antitoxin system
VSDASLTAVASDANTRTAHAPQAMLGVTPAVVLDTNIVLDTYLFANPATAPLRDDLSAKKLRWIATEAMHAELVRVLTYPHIARWIAHHPCTAQDVVDAVQAQCDFVAAPSLHPPSSPVLPSLRCRDRDDQIFIDLAVAHQALLLSKDREVLRLRKALAAHGVTVRSQLRLLAPAIKVSVK